MNIRGYTGLPPQITLDIRGAPGAIRRSYSLLETSPFAPSIHDAMKASRIPSTFSFSLFLFFSASFSSKTLPMIRRNAAQSRRRFFPQNARTRLKSTNKTYDPKQRNADSILCFMRAWRARLRFTRGRVLCCFFISEFEISIFRLTFTFSVQNFAPIKKFRKRRSSFENKMIWFFNNRVLLERSVFTVQKKRTTVKNFLIR